MKAPYIEYDDQVVYPVLEDEGASNNIRTTNVPLEDSIKDNVN